MSASALALLRERRFAPYFWTQFGGAANDNVFKFAFTLVVTYRGASFAEIDASTAANLIAAAFILPFVLLSATSGQLADKFDKSRIMRAVKVLEVGIMLLGLWGFVGERFSVLLACTFLMGVHSTIFGPAKYAYLPQHLAPGEIVGGNGVIEMGTFVAILLGNLLGGILVDLGPQGPVIASCACVAIAALGLLASLFIPATPPVDPQLAIDLNPLRMFTSNMRIAVDKHIVFLGMLGISWLWFFGVLFLTQFPVFARDVLGGGAQVATLLLAMFTFGIALGSLACDRLSRRRLEIGLVPLGSIGMTAFGVDLTFAIPDAPLGRLMGLEEFLGHPSHLRVLFDLFALSACAGLYSVPLYALIQTRCPPEHRARIIAANNILNALFMIVANGYALVVLHVFGASIAQLFLLTALLNAAVATFIYLQVPEFLVRFLAWVLANALYRVRTIDAQRIPARGPALIVANHVSYVDAVLILAVSPRPIRFVVHRSIFELPVLSWLFRQVRAIPIASARDDAALMERAFAQVGEELRAGGLVCIFPEGGLTRDGRLARFRPGLVRALNENPVPVIPIGLRGLWGSLFSYAPGSRLLRKLRRGVSAHVTIAVGPPMAPELASPEHLQEVVAVLCGQ
jgi:1-acyl-sn-glycerol-3-phosphate acyltransferase